jgi:hypothetical protein
MPAHNVKVIAVYRSVSKNLRIGQCIRVFALVDH